MKLSNAEKLMLVMLSEIHEKVGVINGVDTKLLTEAIYSDNTWALDWEMQGIVGDVQAPNPPEVTTVCDILDMWMFIETAYKRLSKPDKERLEVEVGIFGKNPKFAGFDGNNEPRYMSIAKFLVNDMNRFSHFQGRDFNSHSPTVEWYTAMAETFEPIREKLEQRDLSVTEIATILNSRNG